MYTGQGKNIFSFFNIDTIIYHVISACILLPLFISSLKTIDYSKKNIISSYLINTIIQLISLIVGTSQIILEQYSGKNYSSYFFYGYGYKNLPLIGNFIAVFAIQSIINTIIINLFFLFLIYNTNFIFNKFINKNAMINDSYITYIL
jgi:hypothetical protein